VEVGTSVLPPALRYVVPRSSLWPKVPADGIVSFFTENYWQY